MAFCIICMSVWTYRRTVVSIPCGPSALAVKEAAWGLARYAAISQVSLSLSLSLSPEGDNPCPVEKEMEEIGEKLSSPVFCLWKFIVVFFFCPKEQRKEIADSLI